MQKRYAAIEAGGTKWVCAIGTEDGNIIEEQLINTGAPDETLPLVIKALKKLQNDHGKIESIGIGSFGPIGLNPSSTDYGTFINTPKEGWTGYNIIQPLEEAFGKELPIYLDTDVNTAVYAESLLGAGKGLQNICYVTIGTGIGGGVISDGKLIKGRMHPEIGHVPVTESALEPSPSFSSCPFHDNCIEGKASGTAMKGRWGENPDKMPGIAWNLQAQYLAQLAITLTACYSPDLIILGGGVMKHKSLLPLIKREFEARSGNYWKLPPLDDYLVVTSLDDRAGLVGALLLAPK